jgi:hypothetical protein
MEWLHHLFADDETLAREIAKDEQRITDGLQRLLDSYRAKKMAKQAIEHGEPFQNYQHIYEEALRTESKLIRDIPSDEEEMLRAMTALEPHLAIFDEIKQTMDYDLSKERHIYHLLREFATLLRNQAHALRLVIENPQNLAFVKALLDLQIVEDRAMKDLGVEHPRHCKEIILHYRQIANFSRAKHRIESQEERFSWELEHRMRGEALPDGEEFDHTAHLSTVRGQDTVKMLTDHCLNKVQQEAEKQYLAGQIENHPDALYEYVNSHLFEEFVESEVGHHRRLNLQDETFTRLFINGFRDLFNRTRSGG